MASQSSSSSDGDSDDIEKAALSEISAPEVDKVSHSRSRKIEKLDISLPSLPLAGSRVQRRHEVLLPGT